MNQILDLEMFTRFNIVTAFPNYRSKYCLNKRQKSSEFCQTVFFPYSQPKDKVLVTFLMWCHMKSI